MTQQIHHTWTGRIGDLYVLIEQWEGHATISTRSHPWETWSAPTDLDPADVVGFHAAGRAASTVEFVWFRVAQVREERARDRDALAVSLGLLDDEGEG